MAREISPRVAATTLPLTRRAVLAALLSSLASNGAAAASDADDFAGKVAALRSQIGGRLGVYMLDTGTERAFGVDHQDRFAMCSTFKLLLAAAVLARADAGKLSLDQRITYRQQDMLSHAPITSARLSEGAMSVRDLCAATVELSDNPAANLLLPLVGGPSGLTRFVRGLGDEETRLDRMELELNSNLPGDPRDTTTARSMVRTTRKILTEEVLSASSRETLITWLVNSPTGARRIRAGLPKQWKAGGKTGTGQNGAVNDVVIAWPPGRKPIIAAVFASESKLAVDKIEPAHAQVGRWIGEHFAS